jgi:hypothetical protein
VSVFDRLITEEKMIQRSLTIAMLGILAYGAYPPTLYADDAVEFCGEVYTLEMIRVWCRDVAVSDVSPLAKLIHLTDIVSGTHRCSADRGEEVEIWESAVITKDAACPRSGPLTPSPSPTSGRREPDRRPTMPAARVTWGDTLARSAGEGRPPRSKDMDTTPAQRAG